MSGRKNLSRLLTCSVCHFETRSKGGFVWHQTSAHGLESGNGIPGRKRGRQKTQDEGDAAAELDGMPGRPRSRRRLGRVARARRSEGGPESGAGGAGEEPADNASLTGLDAPAGLRALAADAAGSYDAEIRAKLYPLLEMTGVLQQRCARGTAGEDMGVEFHFQSLATRIFSLYEILDDAARAVPIVERRKNSRCGRFNTTRLRALQQFILGVGGASLSVREQKQLYNFLEVRDRRDSVDPMSGTDGFFLSAVFPTVSSFVTALRDELHDAVLSEGWKKLKIREGGTVYEVYYRSVLEVVMARLQNRAGVMRLWSGGGAPAPPSYLRETAMDGDAFRLCEQEVVAAHGRTSFVLGLHLYSDSSQLSWSGCAFISPLHGGRRVSARIVLLWLWFFDSVTLYALVLPSWHADFLCSLSCITYLDAP